MLWTLCTLLFMLISVSPGGLPHFSLFLEVTRNVLLHVCADCGWQIWKSELPVCNHHKVGRGSWGPRFSFSSKWLQCFIVFSSISEAATILCAVF